MTKFSIATLAAVLIASTAPAFADDSNQANLDADSGRTIATTQAPQIQAFDAYASAGRAKTPRTAIVNRNDNAPFQGSNEATRFAPQY